MLPLDLPYGDPDAIRHRGFNNDSPLTRLLTRGVCRLLCEAPERSINPTRRRSQLLRFGLAASDRLQRLTDPRL